MQFAEAELREVLLSRCLELLGGFDGAAERRGMRRRGSSVGCGLVGLALSGLVTARPPAKFQVGRIPFSAVLADPAVRRSGVGCGGGGAAWDAAWWG